jgi:hypothetical protein
VRRISTRSGLQSSGPPLFQRIREPCSPVTTLPCTVKNEHCSIGTLRTSRPSWLPGPFTLMTLRYCPHASYLWFHQRAAIRPVSTDLCDLQRPPHRLPERALIRWLPRSTASSYFSRCKWRSNRQCPNLTKLECYARRALGFLRVRYQTLHQRTRSSPASSTRRPELRRSSGGHHTRVRAPRGHCSPNASRAKHLQAPGQPGDHASRGRHRCPSCPCCHYCQASQAPWRRQHSHWPYSYCWSHGLWNHTSQQYSRSFVNHNTEATKKDKKGGATTTWGYLTEGLLGNRKPRTASHTHRHQHICCSALCGHLCTSGCTRP